ncbi:MAG: hypothetical protein WCH46_00365 [bacterium]
MSSIESQIISSGTIISPSQSFAPSYGMMNNTPSMFQRSLQSTMNPGIDLFGGVSQPFTQFVNGVPQSPMQPTATPAITEHPCQGKGGDDCKCGGSCQGPMQNDNPQFLSRVGNLENVILSTSQEGRNKLIGSKTDDQLLTKFDFNRDILHRSPGSFSKMKVTDELGLRELVEAKVSETNVINLTLNSNRRLKDSISLTFSPLGSDKWRISNGKRTADVMIPPILPLELLNTLAWSAYLVDGWTIEKIKNAVDTKVNGTNRGTRSAKHTLIFDKQISPQEPTSTRYTNDPQGVIGKSMVNTHMDSTAFYVGSTLNMPFQRAQGFTPGRSMCINHDMVCTNEPFLKTMGIVFDNGSTIERNVVCYGALNIDVLDCCKQHDIGFWCAKSILEASLANFSVIGCITNKVNAAETMAYSGGNLLCKIANFFKSVWDTIKGVVSELVETLATLIGELLYVVSVGIDELIYALSLFSIKIPGSWFDLLNQTFSGVADSLANFDGRNSDSCLCGGRVPTTICSSQGTGTKDECRDICIEMGYREEGCYPCSWKCTYDAKGNPTGRVFDRSPNVGMPCCPGTESSYLIPDYLGNRGCSHANDLRFEPCPSCQTCDWNCVQASPSSFGTWKRDAPKADGAPNCCYSAPSGNIDEPCCQPDCKWSCYYNSDNGSYGYSNDANLGIPCCNAPDISCG